MPVLLIRLLGGVRVMSGVALVASTNALGRLLVARRAGTRLFARGFAARDALLGLGMLTAPLGRRVVG